MLNDELFVRAPEGMVPTPRAERMADPIHQALQEMRIVLEADAFEPSQASHSFIISANNYAARAVIPAFVRHVAAVAPSVVVEVRPAGRLDTLDQLDAGAVELSLETLAEGGERFKCVGLLEDEYVAILPRDHPVASEPTLSVEHVGALPHITITSSGDDTQFVDDALAGHGLARRVCAQSPAAVVIVRPYRFKGTGRRARANRRGLPGNRSADHPAAAIRIAACVALDDLASPAGPPRGASLAACNPAGVGQGVVAEPPHHCRKIPCA